VKVLNMDAMVALGGMSPSLRFDLAIVDLPDPHTYSLGKLYTTRFYKLLKEHLHPEGVAAVQSTSPLLARQSFWCVTTTLEAAGFQVRPYHLSVPSFGVWGYNLASPAPFPVPARTLPDLRYLTDESLPSMFVFPKDMARVPTEVNRLDNQVLVHLYGSEWKRWS
jgi:spermidine synthase